MAYRHHRGVYDPKYEANKQRRELEDMLSEWYGNRFAANEITCRSDAPRKLAELLEGVLESKITPAHLQIAKLREEWNLVVGPPLNNYTRFAAVKDGVAFIEVKHSAFLLELRKKDVSASFCGKLQKLCPDLDIQSVCFVPGGQVPEN